MGKIIKTTIDQAKQADHRLSSDWARVDSQSDKKIEEAIASDVDSAPALDEQWFKKALLINRHKDSVTLRLDSDILSYFKQQGKGYQTRINQVLRAFVEAHR